MRTTAQATRTKKHVGQNMHETTVSGGPAGAAAPWVAATALADGVTFGAAMWPHFLAGQPDQPVRVVLWSTTTRTSGA